MYSRHLAGRVREALSDTPVVCVVGARQVGKTTLVRWLADSDFPARYITLDDPSRLASATADPVAFLSALDGPVILDEIQRVPALLEEMKAEVDRDRSPGRFLLTGSANVLVLPELSRALVGRMEVLTLWPLSQGEISGSKERFAERLFAASLPRRVSLIQGQTILGRCLAGGYPEPLGRSRTRRASWFDSYLNTILQRDVRDLAQIDGLAMMPRLFELLAHRSASVVNFSEISRTAGIPQSTLKRYFALLENTFLIRTVPAWARNPTKRLAKSPKLYIVDSGLLSRFAGWTEAALKRDRRQTGPLLESFVAMELTKQISWTPSLRKLYHFRTATGREVDLVLEDETGRLVGVEVKASKSVGADDFRGLQTLRDAAGDRFHRGVVLYEGSDRLPFGKSLDALPIDWLWSLT